MKKVLILTVTAGNGHNACAKGMKEKLESCGAEVKVIDLLKTYSNKWNVWIADKGYNIAVAKLRHIYNAFYNLYKAKKPENRYKCASQGVAISTVTGLLQEIYTYKPDVIYCTHFYAAMAITDLRLVYNIPCKVVVSNLDYVNSPFWEACIGVDAFAVPSDDFIQESIDEGFKPSQLISVGLPVNEKFILETSKSEARKKLGLSDDVFTALVMFGGGHWGGGFKILKNLIKALEGRQAQIIMINGRNKSSYDKVAKLQVPQGIKIVNVGFTNEVDLYMSASDIALNKLGGTSATEMINKQLPMVITEKAPAQELYNLKYFKDKGAAKSFKNAKQLKEIVLNLMDNKEEREKMVSAVASLRRNGIDNLARFMLESEEPVYNQEYIDKIDYSLVRKNVKKALNKAHTQTKKEAKEKRQQMKRR